MPRDEISKPRDFPSVEELLQSKSLIPLISRLPRPKAAAVVKEAVATLKAALAKRKTPLSRSDLEESIGVSLEEAFLERTSQLINATGVVVHTNLGRAPLSDTLFDSIKGTVTGYGNIEYDISSAKRGGRGAAAEEYLSLLSGAESGTVVNNCAAALFIILNTLANRKKVLISRGELVQIGGGFRIPDILKKSGAKLAEVGTTNITSLSDYENGIDQQTALILKVHQSNFTQKGFTDEASLKDLVALGKRHNLPVINDLGSGIFIPTTGILGYREPTVQDSVRAGASLTCFSGDKMLGGVQAGLIVGESGLVKKIKKNPIFRTIRVDKIVFSAVETLLTIYLNGTSQTDVKLWQYLSSPVSVLRTRAERIIKEAGNPSGVTVEDTKAFVGGGALPERPIPSAGLVFSTDHDATKLIAKLRAMKPPIIGRIDSDRLILDLKAVDESEVAYLSSALKKILE